MNTQLKDQLNDLKEAGLLKVKYPAGYKKWKAKFDYWFSITKDIGQTLDCIYGHGGSVKYSKGSIYRNSNLKMPTPEKGTKRK